jgi:diacylglycerol O-acyltransferase / wax synthase
VRRLTSIDAQFLAAEDGHTRGHLCGLSILAPDPTAAPLTLAAIRELIAARLHLLSPLRQRMVEVPLGISYPCWIEDPDLDLDFHITELTLLPPGNRRQLGEQVALIHSRPLVRSRPLWELYLIHGLEGDRLGLLTKVHHAAVDGVAGLELLSMLLDPSPDVRELGRSPSRPPRSVPGQLELLIRGLAAQWAQPLRALRALPVVAPNLDQMPMTRVLPGAAGVASVVRRATSLVARGDRSAPERVRLHAPRTSFNGRISARRRFAFGSLPLEAVKRINRAFATTVNDVVVALTSSALRSWLVRRDELPPEPLLAMVPVSMRSHDDGNSAGNRISTMIVPIPTDESDPRRRLELTAEALACAKERHQSLPATLLQDANEFIPPALLGPASRVIAGVGSRRPFEPPCNVVISNLRGPGLPLYCAGTLVEATHPAGPILDGVGLNVTVLSYRGSLDFGIVADREQIGDPSELIEGLRTGLAELLHVIGDRHALAEPTGSECSTAPNQEA